MNTKKHTLVLLASLQLLGHVNQGWVWAHCMPTAQHDVKLHSLPSLHSVPSLQAHPNSKALLTDWRCFDRFGASCTQQQRQGRSRLPRCDAGSPPPPLPHPRRPSTLLRVVHHPTHTNKLSTAFRFFGA